MKRRLAFTCLPAALLALATLAVRATAAPIQLTDFRMLVRIASPRFSPDGKEIAFVTTRPDFIHDRYDPTLRVISSGGGEPRTLVEGIRDLDMPRWSPDGSALAFIGKVGTRKAQIYTVPAAGGTPTEISDTPHGVQQWVAAQLGH